MNKLITLALVGASALAVTAGAASAQPYGGHDRGRGGYDHDRYDRNDGRQLEARIERAAQRRQITRREAANLRAQVNAVQQLEWRYRRTEGRLSGWERADLDRRYDRIEMRLRVDRHDRDYGHGYGGGYGGGYRR